MSVHTVPPPPADLQAKIRAAIAAAPSPPRARIGPRLSLGIAVVVLAAIAVALRMRPDAAAISATWFFSTVASALLLAIVAVAVAALPGRRGLGAPVTWLAVIVTVTPALYAAITMIVPMHPPNVVAALGSFAEVVRSAWPCFLVSMGVGGVAGVGLAWALRRSVPTAPSLRGGGRVVGARPPHSLPDVRPRPHHDRAFAADPPLRAARRAPRTARAQDVGFLVALFLVPAAISVEGLTKLYGDHAAIDGVTFEVSHGEVVGFLGPNGAGKSTTLKILSGFLGATKGRARIDGFDVVEDADQARQRTGYMPENVPLYPEMRVREYLRFRAEVKRVVRWQRKGAVDRAMGLARVEDVADTLIDHLSKGYRQRVGLADALVARPPLLVLDEPTAGMDPNQIREVRALIRDLGGEHTILLSTHILSEVEATCTRVIVIDRGKLVAEGDPATLGGARGQRRIDIVVRGDLPELLQLLPDLKLYPSS